MLVVKDEKTAEEVVAAIVVEVRHRVLISSLTDQVYREAWRGQMKRGTARQNVDNRRGPRALPALAFGCARSPAPTPFDRGAAV